MKKLRLRKWAISVLVMIALALLLLAGAECDSTFTFTISKVFSCAGLYLIYKVFKKYTDFVDAD